MAKKAKAKHVPMSTHSLHAINFDNGEIIYVNFRPTKKDLVRIYMTQFDVNKDEAETAVENKATWGLFVDAEKLKIYGHEICNMKISR